MAKKMSFFFDKEADILYVTVGKKSAAISKEVGDDILVRVNPKTNEVVGFTILNFTTRFKKMKRYKSLLLLAQLSLQSV